MSAALIRLFLIIFSILHPLSLLIWLVFFIALGGTANVASGTPEQVATFTRFRYFVWLYPVTIVLFLGGGWWLQTQGRFLGAALAGTVPLLHLMAIFVILGALAPSSN